MTRTRLAPSDRREQLLTIGAQLFAERPYDDVSIEEIAARAGVSRGLMYRYFATKRELFRAIVAVGSDRLIDLTDQDSTLPVHDRVLAGLDTYLDHFEANANVVRAANTGTASADDEVRAIIAKAVRRQEDRILDALAQLEVATTPRLRVAVRGWILMTRMLTLDWLENPEISREELRDLCAQSLLALVGSSLG